MGITFRNITVGDSQYGTSERVQCLEHGSQPSLVNRFEYLIQNQKVQSLAIITVTVHEFLHGKDGCEVHPCRFACRELAERSAVHAVTQQRNGNLLPDLTAFEDGITVKTDAYVTADILQELVCYTAECLDFCIGQIGLELVIVKENCESRIGE